MAMSSSTGGGASGNQINQLTVTNSTFTGAATTSIPIEVPPGRNSMAPNLALTYLSQRGNGWVGVGWNIDMGAIQRSTKFGVHYNDNAFVAIANGSSSDLVPRGDWGVNYYGAKIEGAFLKYFDNTATGGGWVVTAKNGTKYYYGSTSASRQDNNSASTVFKWCLDKVQDTNGNYMTVSYVKDQGEIYLDRIDYTGNSGLSPTNYVKFHREGPYNAPDMYVPNFRVKTQYLLRTIEVGVAANIVRAYRLRYTSSPPVYRSVLQQVEFYGNNVQLDNGTPVSGEMLTIFDSSYDPGGTGLTTPNFNNPALPDNLGYPAYGAPGNMFTGDFNGDGKSDYAWFPDGYQRLLIAYGTDNGLTTPIYNQPALPDNLGYPAYGAPGFMFTGDFNGDGKSDYAWFPHGYQRLLIAYGTDNGFTIPNINNPALPDNLGYPVYGGAGNMFIGDFNGDGKSDYAWFPYGHQRLMIAYGTDNGLTTPIYNQPALPDNLGYPAYGAPGFMFTGDFNGDGKSDYAWFPYGPQRLLIAYSTGRGFTIPDFNNPAVPDNLGYPAYGRDGYMFIGDYNGDGKADYAWFPYNYQRLLIAQANIPGHLPDLLESITNLSLGTTTIEYNPSTKYENTLLPFPVYVVKSITANDNNGNVSTTSYSYADGYYDIKDKEFRGFGYAKQTNPNLSTVETWFHQDNVFKGLVEKQEVRDSIDNVVYTQSLNTYLASTPYDNCAFPYLSQTDEYLYDGTPNYKHVAASVEYDNFGNVTRKYNHGDVGIVGDERDDRIEYYYDINKWIVSQPARTYVVIYNNASNKAAESLFTYDSANGNLLVKTDWLNGGTNPVTSFTYNAYGNRITTTDPRNNVTTASAYDATYTYPTTVTDQQTGFAASKTYDSRYGSPLTETDINGNITTYQYDVFGRPKKVINPYDNASTEGTRTIYYENFGLGTGYQRVATHSTEQSGTGNYLWNENYFDGFGRTVKTRSEGPDGKVIVTKTDGACVPFVAALFRRSG
ncbi:MAG: VCBS repeat-containing protein [Deltaproteobacteria bacterium]|nr:VCBS repeat-containing protein [Deltaproteobacteria bacterium]